MVIFLIAVALWSAVFIRGWCLCRSNRERIRPDIIPVFMSMVWEEIRYPISVLPFLWALSACLSTAWKVSKYGVFSGPYFPAFRLNTKRYVVSLRIQSECGKYGPEKTPRLDTFHAVFVSMFLFTSMFPVIYGIEIKTLYEIDSRI